MTWVYQQSTGYLLQDGKLQGIGYSGHADGVNNPAMQNIPEKGPIPIGIYTIGTAFDDPGGKGPCVFRLIPDPSNEMFGRSGFMIHGDNIAHNYSASEGCIVQGPQVRRLIANSNDDMLEVIA